MGRILQINRQYKTSSKSLGEMIKGLPKGESYKGLTSKGGRKHPKLLQEEDSVAAKKSYTGN